MLVRPYEAEHRSYIKGLKRGPCVVSLTKEMLEMARSFYCNLFSARETRYDSVLAFLDAVAGRVPE